MLQASANTFRAALKNRTLHGTSAIPSVKDGLTFRIDLQRRRGRCGLYKSALLIPVCAGGEERGVTILPLSSLDKALSKSISAVLFEVDNW